jgi:xanthosine utilization system XapX-like protein
MKSLDLKTPGVKGILLGLIVAILLILAPTPPGFAIAVGIISAVFTFFVLSDREKRP